MGRGGVALECRRRPGWWHRVADAVGVLGGVTTAAGRSAVANARRQRARHQSHPRPSIALHSSPAADRSPRPVRCSRASPQGCASGALRCQDMRNFLVLSLLAALGSTAPAVAAAQAGTTISGVIRQGENNQPMAGALVVIDELRRETRTGPRRQLPIRRRPAGQATTSACGRRATPRAAPRSPWRTSPVTLDLTVEFDLHFAEVLSVSPNPRPQFESYQPTSVSDGRRPRAPARADHRGDAAVGARHRHAHRSARRRRGR